MILKSDMEKNAANDQINKWLIFFQNSTEYLNKNIIMSSFKSSKTFKRN